MARDAAKPPTRRGETGDCEALYARWAPAANGGTSRWLLTVDPDRGEVLVDYAGTSGASPWGINVARNYTHAYTSFAIKAAICPEVPHNEGSFRPVHVVALRVPLIQVDAAEIDHPHQRRHVVDDRKIDDALGPVVDGKGADPVGPWRRGPLHEEEIPVRPVRVTLHYHRPVA